MKTSPNNQPAPRPATPTERAHADTINPYLHTWYPLWIDAGFTPTDIERWWPLTNTLTMLPTHAERLRDAGWTAQHVADLLAAPFFDVRPEANPGPYQPHTWFTAKVAVAADFIGAVHDVRARAALDARNDLIGDLHAAGWDQPTIAGHLGMTKQRVNVILKARKRGLSDRSPVFAAARAARS